MAQATYTKLRDGSWGLRIQGSAQKGQSITVAKKSGDTKTETIRAILWTGNGITLAAIQQSTPARRFSSRPRRNYDDECELCGEDKYTCGHCIGW